jgi:gamma-glutamylaminecyclotransferase
MIIYVFVFGTLKKGKPLHKCGLEGALMLGTFRTVKTIPLAIAGPWFAPMMFYEPGWGAMSSVRTIGSKPPTARSAGVNRHAINFRILIEVVQVPTAPRLWAFAYMKSRKLAEGISIVVSLRPMQMNDLSCLGGGRVLAASLERHEQKSPALSHLRLRRFARLAPAR